MSRLRRLLASLAAVAALDAAASDLTDTWYAPAESGWGLTLVQQQDAAFATVFAYGDDGSPRWYSATLHVSALQGGNGLPVLSGTLVRSSGPALGAPFDPREVLRVPAGDLHLVPESLHEMELLLTLDGRDVRKRLRRATWRTGPHAEGYAASFAGRRTDAASGRVTTFATTGAATLEIDGPRARLALQQGDAACDYAGEHRPSGRLATVSGTFACSNGRSGTFELEGLAVTDHGFSGRLRTFAGTVSETGSVGGGVNPMARR